MKKVHTTNFMDTTKGWSVCGYWWALIAVCRCSGPTSSPCSKGPVRPQWWGSSACGRAPMGAGHGSSMMLLDAGTVCRQWWWWALLKGGERSWRFIGEGGGPLSPTGHAREWGGRWHRLMGVWLNLLKKDWQWKLAHASSSTWKWASIRRWLASIIKSGQPFQDQIKSNWSHDWGFCWS